MLSNHDVLYKNLMVITSEKSIIHTHTHTKETNPNSILKILIKSQRKIAKEEWKRTAVTNSKWLRKWQNMDTYQLLF